MDAVEAGQTYTVVRDRRPIAQLTPLRNTRRFVSRTEFAAGSVTASTIDIERFRGDQDETYDTNQSDPYAR